MAESKSYHEQVQVEQTIRLREVLKTLPPFAKDFFRAIEPKSSAKTRINYAYDIRVFFHFLMENNPTYKNYSIDQFTLGDLERLEPVDIEEYMEYLKVYKRDDELVTNGEKGLSRKMSALRSFYNYYFKLLDFVENCGNELSGQALNYYKKTKDRDLAILTLLLGTGIRVSECVGLDLTDVDFKNNGITVTRKGGNQMVVYFGEEVEKALKHYIEGDRKAATPLSGHENALFLSTQKRRMGIQAVENMVKKYARQVTPTKKITPHKLRSTYGTSLYKETGDIYLVADVLGHKDVNTTKKHYAAIDEDRRRKAASAVKLRES